LKELVRKTETVGLEKKLNKLVTLEKRNMTTWGNGK